MSAFALIPVKLSTAARPTSGGYAFYLSDGTDAGTVANTLYKMDSAGAYTALINPAYTDEQAMDAIGAALQNTTSITYTYDDAGNHISFAVNDEYVQDVIGALVAAGDGSIVATYNDAAGTLTIVVGSITSAKVSDFTEAVQDVVGGFTSAVDGTISVVYNDAAGTLTIGVGSITSAKVSDFAEAVQDVVGAFLATADSTLTVNYNDAANTFTIARAAITGDVSVPGGSNTATIANDAVTNAKAANMAALTVKGNNTAATADPADLTVAQLLTMIHFGVATRSKTAPSGIAAVATEQVAQVFTIPANILVPGDTIQLHVGGNLTTTVTASNITARARVGGAGTVAGLTAPIAAQELRALNNTAVTRSFTIDAFLTVQANGTSIIGDIQIGGGILAVTAAAASTPVTVAVALTPGSAVDVGLSLTFSAAAGVTAATSAIVDAFISRVA